MGYLVHVNRPNNKARLHVEGGCSWAIRALARMHAGETYGPVRGNDNGVWLGTFSTLAAARRAQRNTGKATQDECKSPRCAERLAMDRQQ